MCELPFLSTKLTLGMTQSNDSAVEASSSEADGLEISVDFPLKEALGSWTLPLSQLHRLKLFEARALTCTGRWHHPELWVLK